MLKLVRLGNSTKFEQGAPYALRRVIEHKIEGKAVCLILAIRKIALPISPSSWHTDDFVLQGDSLNILIQDVQILIKEFRHKKDGSLSHTLYMDLG